MVDIHVTTALIADQMPFQAVVIQDQSVVAPVLIMSHAACTTGTTLVDIHVTTTLIADQMPFQASWIPVHSSWAAAVRLSQAAWM